MINTRWKWKPIGRPGRLRPKPLNLMRISRDRKLNKRHWRRRGPRLRHSKRQCRLLKKRTAELRPHARRSALQMLSAKPWVRSTKHLSKFLTIVPITSHALVSSKRYVLRLVISRSKLKSSRIHLPAHLAQAQQHQVKHQAHLAQLSKPRPPRLLPQQNRILLQVQNEGEKSKISDLITE